MYCIQILLKIELFSTKVGMNFSTELEILYLCTRAIFSIGIQLRPVVSLTPFFCLQSPKRILEGGRVAPLIFNPRFDVIRSHYTSVVYTIAVCLC